MEPTWEKRQPRLRSPAELRSFYAIPLAGGVVNKGWDSSWYFDSQSTLSQSQASMNSLRARSNRTTSLFSAQTSAPSSATSFSDYNKGVDALSTEAEHEIPTIVITSRISDSETPDISIATASTVLGKDTKPPPAPGQTESDVTQCQDYIKRDLPHLKNVRLATACQHCTVQQLGCDKGRPCWNCEQNNQQCCYNQDEATNLGKQDWSSSEVAVEACPDPPSWLDTIREHPYHNLERDQTLGRVGMLCLKSRRGHLFQNQKENPVGEKKEVSEEDLSGASQLIPNSNSQPEEESIPMVEEDDTRDDANSVCSSTLTHTQQYAPTVFQSSGWIIPLDLGASIARRKSLDSLQLSQRPASSSSECHFQAPQPNELCDVVELAPRISIQQATGISSDEPVLFYCLFCFEHFGNRGEWQDHEESQHLEKQRDWICMPWGPVEKSESGEEVCVFCGVSNPSESHCLEHEDEPCTHKSTQERTFRRREDLEKHFRQMHGQREIPEYLNHWSFEPEYETWYWQCGFCDKSMSGWTDRVKHIGNHFQDGLSVLCWDPFVTAGPISKTTGTSVAWFPATNTDQGIRQIPGLDEFVQIDTTEYHCEHCNTFFRNHKDAVRHNEKWHSLRDIWLCHTKKDLWAAAYLQTGPLASYLFPNTTLLPRGADYQSDVCPYCGDLAEDILDEHNYTDWEFRVQHLEDSHDFDTCLPELKFYREDQFLLHLAGTHNLRLNEQTKEIIGSCKRKERWPQKVVDSSASLIDIDIDDGSSISDL